MAEEARTVVVVDGDTTLRYRVVRPPTTSELLVEHHRVHGEPHPGERNTTRDLYEARRNARGARLPRT